MPTYVLTIDGDVQSMKLGSLSIIEAANGRGSLSLIVQSDDGSYRPAKNKTLYVTEDGNTLFGGYIDIPAESALADGGGGIATHVSAVDFNGYTARRQVFGTVPAGNLKAFLTWIVAYLSGWGVTLDAAQVDGPALLEMPFDYISAEDALNQACGGYVWNIDSALKLSAKLPASTPAPFAISGWTDLKGDVAVEPIQSYYANQIIFRFSAVATRAYGFLTLTAGSLADGDTVVVGGTTFTFRTSPSATNDVALGSSNAEALTNLAGAITAVGLCGSYYRLISTYDAILIQAEAAGASGNNITVTWTLATATLVLYGEGLADLTSNLYNGADQSLANKVVVSDAAEIASEGPYEKAISDPNITDVAVATVAATEYLNRSIVDLKKAIYVTLKTGYESGGVGLHPGQLQSITLADRGLSGNFIITDVEIFDFGDGIYARRVTVLGGSTLSYMWQDDGKQIFGGGGSSASAVAYGGGGATTVLSSPFPLGGARERSVGCGTTPTPVLDYLPYEATATFTATVRVEVKAYDAGVAVTPGLYNMTDNVWTWGSAVTSTAFQTQDFTVVLTAGKVYRLDVKTDSATGDAYAIGKLVA